VRIERVSSSTDGLSPRVYALGEYRLAPETRKLTRGDDPVRLANLPFRVLLYLVENRDRVVPRAELLDRFWEGKEVYEDTLRTCVGAIRKALGDSSSAPIFIETRHREGYRYIGPVEEIVPAEEPRPAPPHAVAPVRHRSARGAVALWVVALALTAVVAATVATRLADDGPAIASLPPMPTRPRSIAVMPFENLSGDPAEEYVSDGVAESLIGDLCRINNLKVISRQSAFAFKGQPVDPREVGRRLGVAAIVEGSLRRAGDSIRVEARLVSTEDGRVLWASGADSRLTGNLLDVQETLACQVAAELRTELCGSAERVAKRYTENVVAYREYLAGRYHWNRRSREDLQKAVERFEAAIAADPGYALAYAGLAETYGVMEANAVVPPRSVAEKGEAAARRALQLDETLPSAWAALGLLRSCAWDRAEGEILLERALELNPEYAAARMWYANGVLLTKGRFDEAEAELKRALASDPLSLAISNNLAELYIYRRQYDRAIAQAHASLEINSGPGNAYWVLARAYLALGRNEEAIEAAERSGFKEPSHWLRLHASGKREEERRYLDELARSPAAVERPYALARSYAQAGDIEMAIRYLQRAYETRQAELAMIETAPELDALRSDPRYVEIVRRMALGTG
jgi:TolB-like protein/DNA-binding winged helix-turn-helix (wHTH) protein